MPKRKLDTSNINTRRLEILKKGYLTPGDIKAFVPCGNGKAGDIYRAIRAQIEAEGLENHSRVILAGRILDYMGLSMESIKAGAKLEKGGL